MKFQVLNSIQVCYYPNKDALVREFNLQKVIQILMRFISFILINRSQQINIFFTNIVVLIVNTLTQWILILVFLLLNSLLFLLYRYLFVTLLSQCICNLQIWIILNLQVKLLMLPLYRLQQFYIRKNCKINAISIYNQSV
ncbi:unnamed protein product (macronuclear) [Paramecium tetraurelia]|uniref:Transmembrane protein n=1 Tax=Paramecium tetraurelia TaxID=5888 RepID=A0DY32_PARTE|nr:uncharacterized protein GSPATT00039831001 [Paramecium tetraurelia]CAK87949.1 unnamed protein product [Paramecium tetraurelia]|eukprot:XP_001455346.1 hypothetical protein (macronuclear) [Paramecium tetraurelia strain d4-2]